MLKVNGKKLILEVVRVSKYQIKKRGPKDWSCACFKDDRVGI